MTQAPDREYPKLAPDDEWTLSGVPTMWGRANDYYRLRGLDTSTWQRWPAGDKFQEEAQELLTALDTFNARYNPRGRNAAWPTEVRHEIADVAITLAWIAHQHGTTIEACMAEKTAKDAGRGPGVHYMKGN